MTTASPSLMPSRRAVAKTAAWAAPVIAAAVATPMAAASPLPDQHGKQGHIRWNPEAPYATEDRPYRTTGENVLQIMADARKKGWVPGNQVILTCSGDAAFTVPGGQFPATLTGAGPSGAYTITFSSAAQATIMVTEGFAYLSHLNVVIPAGYITWAAPYSGKITATPHPTFLSNSAVLDHA